MTKAKAARRKSKRAITLPGGIVVSQGRPHPRDRIGTQKQDDPRKTVIAARKLRIPDGADPLHPMAGCRVGRRLMEIGNADERARLWGAVCHMRRVYATYASAIGAPSRYPKCLSILTPAEHIEAQDHHVPVDDRDDEARQRDAVRAYMAVQGWLQHTDAKARYACTQAVIDDAAIRDWPGILLALECVAEGHSTNRVTCRSRY